MLESKSIKNEVLAIINDLPYNVTLDEIMAQLYMKHHILQREKLHDTKIGSLEEQAHQLLNDWLQ